MSGRYPPDKAVQAAAFLSAAKGLSQAEVGRILGGISQSLVSRLLQRAETEGWLERRFREVTPLDRAWLSELEALHDEPAGLVEAVKAFGRLAFMPDIRVVDVGRGTSVDERAVRRRLEKLGTHAAAWVDEMLTRADVCACTWGTTLSYVVDALEKRDLRTKGARTVRITPVCAEPLDEGASPETSTHLARRLHKVLASTAPPPPSLTGLPAIIPNTRSSRDAKVIRDFVESTEGYREVFGGKTRRAPLIAKADMLLTSVGGAGRPMGFNKSELLKAAGTAHEPMPEKALAELIDGDIGGVLLPKPDLTAAGRRSVEVLSGRWTGIKRHHLEGIVARARKSGRPGVVVIASGAERAGTIRAALAAGLVNTLIITTSLAEALEAVLRSDARQRPQDGGTPS